MSEVDEISRETKQFGTAVANVWMQLRNRFAVNEVRQAHHDQVVSAQARQLRRITAHRDQLLIDVEELTRERDQLAHELEGARAELDQLNTPQNQQTWHEEGETFQEGLYESESIHYFGEVDEPPFGRDTDEQREWQDENLSETAPQEGDESGPRMEAT